MSAQRTIRVVAAVLEKDGKYLITQRRATAVLPLMWEFPGGRVEAGETDAQALKREVLHRLGATIDVGKLISFVSHPYEGYVVDLFLYECALTGGRLEGGDQDFMRVLQDTRKLGPGDLFVAIKGEHYDGHDFLVASRSEQCTA